MWRDKVEEELAIRRPIWLVMLYSLGLSIAVCVTMPLNILIIPIAMALGMESDKLTLMVSHVARAMAWIEDQRHRRLRRFASAIEAQHDRFAHHHT